MGKFERWVSKPPAHTKGKNTKGVRRKAVRLAKRRACDRVLAVAAFAGTQLTRRQAMQEVRAERRASAEFYGGVIHGDRGQG